ncbi:MAG: EAL domain-containing protein [Burkholderiales bacterium]|nr:EAL domain-containing protein [Burkholderiales bacterium]
MVWSNLVEAVLLLTGGLVLFGVWFSARLRDRRATQALRASEERFRHLTALSADWFWETDAQHRIRWLSGGPAVAALFGGELAHGRRLWEVPGAAVEPRALVDYLERLEELDARMPFFDFLISRSEAGERRTHRITGKPRYDVAGQFLGYRGVGQDITERLRAERALGDAKERLELATEGGNLAVWDIDVGSDQMHLGGGLAAALGTRPGQTSMDLHERVHPADREALRRMYVRALKEDAGTRGLEFRMRTVAGEWKWLVCTGRVTERERGGRALRMSGTLVEIDARKRAEQASRDAEERYRTLVELAPNGVMIESDGIIEYINGAAAAMLGAATARQLLGTRTEDLIHPDHAARYRERIAYLRAGPGKTPFEERRLRRLDGGETVLELAGVSYLERGRLVQQTVLRDVTEQRKAREALAERERRFRDVLDASGEYVWETDAAWRYTFLSERVETVLGYLRHELLGRAPRELMPLADARATGAWLESHAAKGAGFRDIVHRSITKSGRVIWQSVNGVPVFDAAGRLAGFRGTGADITARKLAEERIQYLATRDPLTGLPNRLLLADRAGQAILTAARSQGSLALLTLDLDRFNLVNDSLGHAAGDTLLRAVAERLAATLRRDDTLARLGGDEFALLWNGMKGSDDAATLAQRALSILARPFTVEGRTLSVTASIGISVYPSDGRDFGELLRNADAAKNHAKETGRNTFRFFSPELNEQALRRLGMENDLRHALARNELLLHWQPVVSMVGADGRSAAGRVVGAEALLRWRHPREGLLMPDAFIPVAEDCGLIRPLGQWTLERALGQVAAWRRGRDGVGAPATGDELWIALNVSATELAQGDVYVAQLRDALAANGLPGRVLELEVTERVLMSHLPENLKTLRKLGELGVRVAIDDFGTGYSSLAYLRQLPIDKLKIDRSFLSELDAHPHDATIVQTITAMALSLGLRVGAEGVESEAQLERLRLLGCDEWQGHLYSAPVDAAGFERLIAKAAAGAASPLTRAAG